MDNLLFSESWHYDHDPVYRNAVQTWLKEHDKPLRRPSSYNPSPTGMGIDTFIKGRDGHTRARSLRKQFRAGEIAVV